MIVIRKAGLDINDRGRVRLPLARGPYPSSLPTPKTVAPDKFRTGPRRNDFILRRSLRGRLNRRTAGRSRGRHEITANLKVARHGRHIGRHRRGHVCHQHGRCINDHGRARRWARWRGRNGPHHGLPRSLHAPGQRDQRAGQQENSSSPFHDLLTMVPRAVPVKSSPSHFAVAFPFRLGKIT